MQVEAENVQLKKKISNFISDSQDAVTQRPAAKQLKTDPTTLPSPIVPSIKATGRLSLKSPIIGTPPSMSRNSSSEYRGSSHQFGGFPPFQGGHETPNMSEMWNPGLRSHPNLPHFNPMQSQQTPGNRHVNQYPNFAPHPNNYPQYYQHPPAPPINTPNQSSAFGSPRPFYRRGGNGGGGAPYNGY